MRPPIRPNLTLLQNALDQTEGVGAIRADEWERQVLGRLESLSDEELRGDAAAFLERRQDAELLSIENLRSVL